MMNLYSTGCPKCKVLEAKLKQKNLTFNEICDLEILKQKGILSLPVLEVDGNFLNFSQAISFVNGL